MKDEITKELNQLQEEFKSRNTSLEEINKTLKKLSFDKKAVENRLRTLDGAIQYAQSTLSKLEAAAKLSAEPEVEVIKG